MKNEIYQIIENTITNNYRIYIKCKPVILADHLTKREKEFVANAKQTVIGCFIKYEVK